MAATTIFGDLSELRFNCVKITALGCLGKFGGIVLKSFHRFIEFGPLIDSRTT
jgi:hypothetical protein